MTLTTTITTQHDIEQAFVELSHHICDVLEQSERLRYLITGVEEGRLPNSPPANVNLNFDFEAPSGLMRNTLEILKRAGEALLRVNSNLGNTLQAFAPPSALSQATGLGGSLSGSRAIGADQLAAMQRAEINLGQQAIQPGFSRQDYRPV